eukprot:UN12778
MNFTFLTERVYRSCLATLPPCSFARPTKHFDNTFSYTRTSVPVQHSALKLQGGVK